MKKKKIVLTPYTLPKKWTLCNIAKMFSDTPHQINEKLYPSTPIIAS